MEVGLIGCGDMGKLYARRFSAANYSVSVCDLPDKYDSLVEELKGTGINVLRDGFQVSRLCDFIIYSVEAENIASVVALYGPATKIGAVVAGQTSVKEPEIQAFEKYLPADVDIMTLHSLHGPSISPEGQALVVVKHRISEEKYNTIVEMCRISLKSQIVHLSSYLEHDRITADTQAVTHLAFLSMGTAWKNCKIYPWRSASYVGGIENVKTLMTLRIFSNKYHVYAGLAILNPSAQQQVRQYASSVTELFKLIVQERREELKERLLKAGEFVFGKSSSSATLLSDDVLKEYSLSQVPIQERKPNSHLSLLAMIDSWHQLKINPYDHILCQTPLFRMWLGIVEYLFKNKEMFDGAIDAAINSKDIRNDDLEFAMAARDWATIINESNFEGYKKRFLDASVFFEDQLAEGNKLSAKLIAKLRENSTK